MLFNSIEFFIFFPIILLLYYTLPKHWRIPLLLVASCFFYLFFIPAFLLILILVIGIDYLSAISIERYFQHRKLFLSLSIISNIGILCFFKYYNFFLQSSNELFGTHWTLIHLILPIGLSFHTFQSLSYVLEVYYKRFPAEKNLGYFSLYVMYFPQLVAGPIESPQQLIPQFKHLPSFSSTNLIDGYRLILWGLFKKVVIADRISFYVNGVFEHTAQYNSYQILLGIIFFTIQIYCDFSGYSDMAKGISTCFGIDLMTNFNRPFFSKNIAQFWSTWHISLSTWFKNYIYIPLGGNKKSIRTTLFNVLLVFTVSGIWHGAGLNFIIWGLGNGIMFALYYILKKYYPSILNIIPNSLAIIITFGIISILFVFFRSHQFEQTLTIFNHLLHFNGDFTLTGIFDSFPFGRMNLAFIFFSIGFMFCFEYFISPDLKTLANYKKTDIFFLSFIACVIFFMGIFNNQNFIYFQF